MKNFLKPEDFARLARIVREETGNQVQEKNFSMLESRIRSHVSKLGITSIELYWAHFERNEKEEREAIQSLMTTHYTFFFREYAHFEVLENWIETEKDALKARFARTGSAVRVWSAASSRGQEAYSIAMFLEEKLFKKHGLPFEIVGTDIDAESVAHAKNGVYPLREVNAIPKAYLDDYWKKGAGPVKDFAAANAKLKSRVRFQTLNLLELHSFDAKEKFDVVFCRNVFIYFSAENVKSIASNLADRLNANGLFVSGMSEPLRFEGWPLISVGPSCYQKAEAQKSVAPLVAPASRYRVLCVDDSPTIQMLMKKIFAQDSLCGGVDVAGNGREAKDKLNVGTYDLITLDIHMPDVSGIEFLEKFYDRKAHPPVLMVSSVNRSDLDLATKSIALGAFDYVEKPNMNGLQKSADEILAKAKMAMRADRRQASATPAQDFDIALGEKIVIPDASQCLRAVFASSSTLRQLEQIVRGQDKEYRSPPLLIVWKDEASLAKVEAEILNWTSRPVVSLRDAKQALRPNYIYVECVGQTSRLAQPQAKSISLQVLDQQMVSKGLCQTSGALQVLLDEATGADARFFERETGLKVSEVTPATSFASLSCEFFANLRKAAA